jgi:hypothetical protein
MWSFDDPEATDTIFMLNFESPTDPSHGLACICRPFHYDADEYGVIPYSIIGLGAIPQSFLDGDKREHEQHLQVTSALLHGDLQSIHGRKVSDGISGYGLEVSLPELISLCRFARITGSFVRWSIDEVTADDHWQWSSSKGGAKFGLPATRNADIR